MGRAEPKQRQKVLKMHPEKPLVKIYTSGLFIENLCAAKLEGCARSQAMPSSVGVYVIDRQSCDRTLVTALESLRRKVGNDGS
jgi:hypothetical protein